MKGNYILLFSTLLLVSLSAFTLAELTTSENSILEGDELVCTQDVKLCSDGSYVSRNSSNGCEFNLCPDEEEPEAMCDELKCEEGYQSVWNGEYDESGCPIVSCNLVEKELDEDDETESTILGASCGTVTPGYQNECCKRKGYGSWDPEEWGCTGEPTREREAYMLGTINSEDDEECEEWNCTRWSECVNGISTRECVKSGLDCTDEDDEDEENETEQQQPRLTRHCYDERGLRPPERTLDCPEECICAGSTIKCSFENGTRVMTVYAGQSGNVIVQVKNLNMSTNVTLYRGEDGTVYGTFKGNRTHEIKLPDDVVEELKEKKEHRLRLENTSINLTEDGYYQVQTKKKARLFWLVPVKEHMAAEIDAETGEIIKIRNPWWGFLARDVRVNEENSED